MLFLNSSFQILIYNMCIVQFYNTPWPIYQVPLMQSKHHFILYLEEHAAHQIPTKPWHTVHEATPQNQA